MGTVEGCIGLPHECRSTHYTGRRTTLSHAHRFSSHDGKIQESSPHTQGSIGWQLSEALLPSQKHTEGFCKQRVCRSQYHHDNGNSGMNQAPKLWRPPTRNPDRHKHLQNEAILQIPPMLGPPRATLSRHPLLLQHPRWRSPAFSIQEPAHRQNAGFRAPNQSAPRAGGQPTVTSWEIRRWTDRERHSHLPGGAGAGEGFNSPTAQLSSKAGRQRVQSLGE